MFSLSSSLSYYLYGGQSDMRKSFDGLCGLVRDELKRDPLSGEVFIFISRRRNTMKLLHWEEGGFVLYYKRLERGTIEMPEYDPLTRSCRIRWTDLVMMVEGLSMRNVKVRKRYSEGLSVDKNVDKNSK